MQQTEAAAKTAQEALIREAEATHQLQAHEHEGALHELEAEYKARMTEMHLR